MGAVISPQKILAYALKYADTGWHVFPVYEPQNGVCSCSDGARCETPAKHPRTPNGLLNATTDANQIRAWWRQWPNANIGISTGPSFLAVLDIDPRHGGDETLRGLLADQTEFATPLVLTGGGGEQYYFRATTELKSRAPAFGDDYPGVDLRALGGYVIAPPSLHISGNRYTWEASSPSEFQEIPEWCAKMRLAMERTPISGVDTQDVIIAGERNAELARYAGRLRRLGTSVEAMTDALLAMNRRQVNPPLPEREVRAIAKSIGRYAPAEVPQTVTIPNGDAIAVVDIADVPDTDDSDSRRYFVGIENIDRHMGPIRAGEFMVIGARQGHGKTALAETIAIANAVHRRVMFATLEMTIEDVRDRMIGRILKIPLTEVERLRKVGDSLYKQGRDSVDSLNLKFYRQTKSSLRTSVAVMQAAEQQKADMLIVDYTRSLGDWQDGNARVCSEIVERFSMWCKQHRITLVLLSQLNRDAQGRRPIESQLQDTGRLEQEAEKVLLLWRPFVGDKRNDNICEITCAKNRRGPAFRGHVHWTGATTSFHPMTREEESAAMCCQSRGGGKAKSA